MILLITIALIIAVLGGFLIIGISPFEFYDGLVDMLKPKKTSIRSQIQASRIQKKPGGLSLLFLEVRSILRVSGKEGQFSAVCVFSLLLFILGILMALAMNNVFMIPVLAIGFSLLPFYYIKFMAIRQKKQINGALETDLSMITTSYMRNKNTFIKAVEENLPYLNSPVSEVFQDFLLESKLINSNMTEALDKLKLGINSAVFQEWVDAIIMCQEDHNLKSTLPPIVAKLSDMRVVAAELDLLIYEPVKEYITMGLLVVGSIPLLYFLNGAWYETLMYTGFGKSLLAISGSVIFISMAAVIKHIRPIEYMR